RGDYLTVCPISCKRNFSNSNGGNASTLAKAPLQATTHSLDFQPGATSLRPVGVGNRQSTTQRELRSRRHWFTDIHAVACGKPTSQPVAESRHMSRLANISNNSMARYCLPLTRLVKRRFYGKMSGQRVALISRYFQITSGRSCWCYHTLSP